MNPRMDWTAVLKKDLHTFQAGCNIMKGREIMIGVKYLLSLKT